MRPRAGAPLIRNPRSRPHGTICAQVHTVEVTRRGQVRLRRVVIAYEEGFGLIPGIGETTIEYGTDTARAIARWVMSGSAKRFPDIRWIHSHGGGTLSGMTGRFLGDDVQHLRGDAPADSRLHYIRQYHYDMRRSDNWAAAAAFKRMVGASQSMFGYFDIPRYFAFDGPKEFQKIVDTGEFTEAELLGISHGNVLKLFPDYA